MTRFTRIVIAAFIILSVMLESCRKGENDPFFSLRTRKARVAGGWSMSSGSSTATTVSPSGTNTESWTHNGNLKVYTTSFSDTSGTISNTYTEPYRMYCSFDKEGTFVLTEIVNGETTTKEGDWNFTNDMDMPGRSQLLLMTSKIVYPFGGMELFEGDQRPKDIFNIDELRNKKLVLIQEGTITERGVTATQKLNIVLEQE